MIVQSGIRISFHTISFSPRKISPLPPKPQTPALSPQTPPLSPHFVDELKTKALFEAEINKITMKHNTFLCCLLLMLPTLFMGQVLQETTSETKALPDPDQYPVGIYFKLGMPSGSFAYGTGHGNIRRLFRENEINLPTFVGLNYGHNYLGVSWRRFIIRRLRQGRIWANP